MGLISDKRARLEPESANLEHCLSLYCPPLLGVCFLVLVLVVKAEFNSARPQGRGSRQCSSCGTCVRPAARCRLRRSPEKRGAAWAATHDI
eukprot:2422747-Pleurochrysis_carterae.AAC.1